MNYNTSQIRNISIAGHGATGKTTLLENLLFAGAQIDHPETIESGKTISDYTEEEIEHKISIHSSLSHIFWKNKQINVLDTPGASDFVGEVLASFRACETAVLLIDAESGVQIETLKLWRRLDERNKPRIIFINKMDKERADFTRVLADLNEKFKTRFIPLTLPLYKDEAYCGTLDLVQMKAFCYQGTGQKETLGDIPQSAWAQAQEAHNAMLDAAAEGDDDLTEKFLEGQDFNQEETLRGLSEDLRDHKIVPVFCGSALKGTGLLSLLDFITLAAPSPAGLHDWAYTEDHQEVPKAIELKDPPSFFTFKTAIDQFAGKLSYVKIISGIIKPDMELINKREQRKDKLSKLYKANGKKLEEVQELIAGDLGILAKLGSAHTNDSYYFNGSPVEYRPLRVPKPVYHLALQVSSKKEEDKLSEYLNKILEEDKTLALHYNEETQESVLSGMGEMHLNLVFERLRKANKLDIQTHIPKIAYRETISQSAEAEYTHKKQSGGHGQYAKVLLKISPLERGMQFNFINEVHGGAISKNYLPGIEKGLLEGMKEGCLAGYPVVDLEAHVLDGKEHPVDSSDLAFQLAGRGALKEALKKAKPQLLEPIMSLKVFVEEQYLGDILSDLSSRRARVLGQNLLGSKLVEVDAEAPQAELLNYSIDLRSKTSGTGSFEAEFAHYAGLSERLSEELIKKSNSLKEQNV